MRHGVWSLIGMILRICQRMRHSADLSRRSTIWPLSSSRHILSYPYSPAKMSNTIINEAALPQSRSRAVVNSSATPANQIIRNERFAAVMSLRPTTPGYTIITADGIDNLTTLSIEDFISLMAFTKRTARALEDSIGVQRIGLAADDKAINFPPWCRKSNCSCRGGVSYHISRISQFEERTKAVCVRS